jgi:murein DD-endopeptidase MepM/ murein hydrolase activator NlpD
MTTRILAWITIAVTGVVLLCSGLVGTLFTGSRSASAGCYLPVDPSISPSAPAVGLTPPVGGFPAIGTWSPEQVSNAATIVTVGVRSGVPPRGWVIALATAMQESSLINNPGGDQDSIGLFQQRPSQGWGTPAQLHDPTYAAGTFYATLLSVNGWQAMALTDAAQAVQRSAYPDAYATWETDATHLVAALTGLTGALAACSATIGPQRWTQPVHGPIVSAFRTPDRPTHNGVDIAVPKGTPIHAAAAGTVTTVRCQAIAPDGSDWGCDRDGSPDITGCGWYVDIEHTGGIVTRYCHQLVHPAVTDGQHVGAGDVVGISGSSGNSSGPHLHFEVHLGGHDSATAIDPVPFMASVGTPLQ